MQHEPLTILITGAGAPGTRGTTYALRQNPDRRPVRTVGVDANQNTAGRYLVDRFYTVPPPEDPSYLQVLSEVCQRESVCVIIPQTTREIAVLSQQKQYFGDLDVSVMVSDASAIARGNDKWQLLQDFERLKLPVPMYTIARTESELVSAVHDLGYPATPVAVKPPVSNGMRGVRILREDAWDVGRFLSEKPSGLEISLDDLRKILTRGGSWPELLVTEYLPGDEYTVDLFVGSHSRVAIPRRRVSIRSGITFESALEWRTDLCDYSIRASLDIGLQYAVGFQFKLDAAGVPKVLECNPRVQGTMVASVFSGINVIWLSVRELIGDEPVEIPPHNDCVAFYRYWGGFSVDGDRIEEI